MAIPRLPTPASAPFAVDSITWCPAVSRGERCSRQPATGTVSVSLSRDLPISPGKALAEARARVTSTRASGNVPRPSRRISSPRYFAGPSPVVFLFSTPPAFSPQVTPPESIMSIRPFVLIMCAVGWNWRSSDRRGHISGYSSTTASRKVFDAGAPEWRRIDARTLRASELESFGWRDTSLTNLPQRFRAGRCRFNSVLWPSR